MAFAMVCQIDEHAGVFNPNSEVGRDGALRRPRAPAARNEAHLFTVAAKKGAAGILPAEAASDHKAQFCYLGRASICRQDAGNTLCGHDVQLRPAERRD